MRHEYMITISVRDQKPGNMTPTKTIRRFVQAENDEQAKELAKREVEKIYSYELFRCEPID